jgi:autotransporter translocation and assembly factor TamB
VLDLTFPHPIPALVGYIKLLFLDVRSLVKLDCMNVGGFYGKIMTNVVVVPLAVVALCFLIFEAQRRTLAAGIAAGAADQSAYEPLKVKLKHNLFLGIFLVYPVSLHDLYGLSHAAKHPALRLEAKCGVRVCRLSRRHSFVSFSASTLARHHSTRTITTSSENRLRHRTILA